MYDPKASDVEPKGSGVDESRSHKIPWQCIGRCRSRHQVTPKSSTTDAIAHVEHVPPGVTKVSPRRSETDGSPSSTRCSQRSCGCTSTAGGYRRSPGSANHLALEPRRSRASCRQSCLLASSGGKGRYHGSARNRSVGPNKRSRRRSATRAGPACTRLEGWYQRNKSRHQSVHGLPLWQVLP